MKLKEINKNGVVAWSTLSHIADHVVTGNWAGSTTDFGSTARPQIEILGLDLQSSSPEPKSLGKVECRDKIWNMSWGGKGNGVTQDGLIASAMTSGGIDVWDAGILMGKKEGEKPFVGTLKDFSGSARTVQFNHTQTNLLGIGATGGEVLMVDLTRPDSPQTHSTVNKSDTCQTITDLAWSYEYAHILACTSMEGWTCVWDLRQKNIAVQFPSDGKRLSSVLWHPADGMQMAVACENDDPKHAVIQVWDLRSVLSPRTTLVGHQKGILSASWCPHDPALLLSCGKDNLTICWNTELGQPLHTLPSSWNFQVRWAPCIPSVLSISAIGPPATISFHSLHDVSTVPASSGTVKPPKWMRKPCGAVFGFGNTLFSFDESHKNIHRTQIITDHVLVEKCQKLEEADAQNQLIEFCEMKVQGAQNESSKQIWAVMKALFEPDTRKQLLLTLGKSEENAANLMNDFLGKNDTDEVDDKFGNLALNPQPKRNLSSSELEFVVQEAILVGSKELAVNCLLDNGRTADALVLAASSTPEFWEATRLRYLEMNKSSSSLNKLLYALLKPDLSELVQTTTTTNWKSTLSVLLTYATQDQFSGLCQRLASQMEDIGEKHAALLCYMCAGDVSKVVELWLVDLKDHTSHESLIEAMERITVFRKAHQNQVCVMTSEARLHFCRYAELLASQGVFKTALNLLQDVSSSTGEVDQEISQRADILRHRIYMARRDLFSETSHIPPSPFSDNNSKAQQNQQQQHHYQQQQQQQQYYQQQQQQQQTQQYYQQQQQQPFPTQTQTQQHYQQNQNYQQPQTNFSQFHPDSTPSLASKLSAPSPSATLTPFQPSTTTAPVVSSSSASSPASSVPVSSTQPKPVQAVPGPNQTVLDLEDVSNVGDGIKIVTTLRAYALAIHQAATPENKKKMDDTLKRLCELLRKLNAGSFNPQVLSLLSQLTAAMDLNDFGAARHYCTTLTANHWEGNGTWLIGLKRILDTTN